MNAVVEFTLDRRTDSSDRLAALRAEVAVASADWDERAEVVLDGGIEYVEGDPVEVFVRKRLHRYLIDDLGGAVDRAGRPPGWLEAARRVAEDEHWLNVGRNGHVFVPAVEGGFELASLVLRVADASVAVHQELLELE
jgi:hypothetical protein